MKKIIFTALAILVIATSLIAINKRMNKGNLMDNTNTYTVIAPNGNIIEIDKKTNLIVSKNIANDEAYLKEKSQYATSSRSCSQASP